MNAIELLKHEHANVRDALKVIEKSKTIHTQKTKFSSLAKTLIRHESMEHAIWYPKILEKDKLDKTVSHLLKEENHAENQIKKLHAIEDDKLWLAEFRHFKNAVEQHANEEETKLFPMAEKIFSTSELNEIGAEMKSFKDKLPN